MRGVDGNGARRSIARSCGGVRCVESVGVLAWTSSGEDEGGGGGAVGGGGGQARGRRRIYIYI